MNHRRMFRPIFCIILINIKIVFKIDQIYVRLKVLDLYANSK